MNHGRGAGSWEEETVWGQGVGEGVTPGRASGGNGGAGAGPLGKGAEWGGMVRRQCLPPIVRKLPLPMPPDTFKRGICSLQICKTLATDNLNSLSSYRG